MRKFNKLFILISIILLSFACMGCKSDYESFIDQFDLEDVKVKDIINDDQEILCDSISITFKTYKTYEYDQEYMEFKLEYLKEFNLKSLDYEDVVGFSYISTPRPTEYLFKEEYSMYLKKHRCSVHIYLINQDRDKIMQIIKELEKLEFIYGAFASGVSEPA